MSTIHIAVAFDESYAPHAAATMASILVNAASEDQLEFHVLDNGLLDASRNWLIELVRAYGSKIQFIKPDLARFAACPTKHHARAAYSRLALPDLLPALDRIIYLDSDLIVLRSLGPVWASDLKGNAALVVRDAADLFGSHFLEHKQRLGLRLDQPAFNSGVMLLDLKMWREHRLVEAVLAWIERNPHLMLHSDQDALNAVLKDQVGFLDPAWNVQVPLIRAIHYCWIQQPEWVAAVRSPAIIHYTGNAKPWLFSCAVPRRRDYHQYAKLSAGPARSNPLQLRALTQRLGAEVREFRWWLAALVKGRLRSI